MSSSPAVEQSYPPSTPSSPAPRPPSEHYSNSGGAYLTSTPNYGKGHKQHPPLHVVLPPPSTPPTCSEATLTPPPRSPGAASAAATGDARPPHHPPDGTSSDKSSETAVGGGARSSGPALSRKESYKAQRQHYRREKKRAASALLHSIEDPAIVVLADWLKVRGSLKSWTKLWCVLKPGLLLLFKSSKAKSSHWVGTVLLTSCQVIERPSKKDGFCFKLYHPLEQSIWAPRGPHNETIGAVVQPLPTAHLIFRAPSQAAGHCWLDGLELALKCSNAMLRCSRSRGPLAAVACEQDAGAVQAPISHEELERHFNEHELEGANLTDSESEMSVTAEGGALVVASCDLVQRRLAEVLELIKELYVEDMNVDVGASGELVEEIAEENKSLLWFLVKQVRPGMDLSKVVLPTFILEPRSFLDKLSDNYYHADLLASAARCADPYQRFKTVVRWYLSGLYRKPRGLKKPYNPVLGELFRCCWHHPETDTRTYYVAEQVSHHPPVSAFYISNRKEGFVIEGSLLAKSKFYGNSTSAILEGSARVVLVNLGETYVTTAPYAHCKGLVVGTLSMELGGKVQISCASTGYQADIDFKLKSFLGGSDQTNAISGRIKRGKETVANIEGYWDGKIDIKEKKTGEEYTLLDCNILKEHRLRRFLVRVDKQLEFESQRLWQRVSQAIADDDQVAATEEKTVIEEAQRERARSLSVSAPRFFHKAQTYQPPEGVMDQGWRYNHINTEPWGSDAELVEYEDEFVVRSLRAGRAEVPVRARPAPPLQLSDSDVSLDDTARRSKLNGRNLKKSLRAIDHAIRDQTQAIERLSLSIEAMGSQRQAVFRTQNVGRLPSPSSSWDLFGGFILAMILQALLNWIFFHRN